MKFAKHCRNVLAATILALAAAAALFAAPPKPSQISTVLVSDGTGHGSGVHIGNGYIVTAAHVVEDRPEMQVMDSAGNEQTGVVLWSNKANDIALLRVTSFSTLRKSPLVCAPRLAVGDELQAVGSPINLQFVHTWGRVAADIRQRGPWAVSVVADMTLAPGMSGGPVFDHSGGVVGIAVGIAVLPTGFSGSPLAISYIVPSSVVCMLMARGA